MKTENKKEEKTPVNSLFSVNPSDPLIFQTLLIWKVFHIDTRVNEKEY